MALVADRRARQRDRRGHHHHVPGIKLSDIRRRRARAEEKSSCISGDVRLAVNGDLPRAAFAGYATRVLARSRCSCDKVVCLLDKIRNTGHGIPKMAP